MAYNETSNMINKVNTQGKYALDNPTMNDDYLFAASSHDATGLAPTIAHDEYEAASYEEIYPYLPPVLPNSATAVPEPPMSEGIHAEMRMKVSPQNHKPKDKYRK